MPEICYICKNKVYIRKGAPESFGWCKKGWYHFSCRYRKNDDGQDNDEQNDNKQNET